MLEDTGSRNGTILNGEGKPFVITETGVQSKKGMDENPGAWDPDPGVTDEEMQAEYVHAMQVALKQKEFVLGVFWWRWGSMDEKAQCRPFFPFPQKKAIADEYSKDHGISYTPHGKLAEVLTYWFNWSLPDIGFPE